MKALEWTSRAGLRAPHVFKPEFEGGINRALQG